MRQKTGQYKNCVVCKKEFYVPKYRIEKSKYCSVECQNHGQYESIKKICLSCGKEFYVSNSRVNKKYCSDLCKQKSNYNIKEMRKKQKVCVKVSRKNATSYMVRKFAFLHKPKKCEICGYDEYDFNLDVHHYDENPLNNDLSNLKVLCVMCHRKLHKGIIEMEK